MRLKTHCTNTSPITRKKYWCKYGQVDHREPAISRAPPAARNGNDFTARFPLVVAAVATLGVSLAVERVSTLLQPTTSAQHDAV
jgi:hypothetical protein